MKATKLGSLALGVSLLAAAGPTAAYADVVTFTFENLPVQHLLTSLTLGGGGLTATLTRPGSNFAITDESFLSGFGFPSSWGQRTLDPFDDLSTNTPFFLNFSQAITGLSIDMGDLGCDLLCDNDVLTLQLFSGLDGTGTLLGTATTTLFNNGLVFSFATPSVTASGARSARFVGVGDTPNSVYYDNITVTFTPTAAVPEPGTLALMASGLLGVGLIRRRKRS